MTKELLDLPQVRARAQELGGKHVAQRVRRDSLALVHAGRVDVAPEQLAQLVSERRRPWTPMNSACSTSGWRTLR